MAQMALQKIVPAGLSPVLSAANTNDAGIIGTGHNTFLYVKNGSGSSITVTVQNFDVEDTGDAVPNKVVTVLAGAQEFVPLFKAYDKGDGTGAQFTYSAVTTVTSALVQASW
jgi:hypothetical protein